MNLAYTPTNRVTPEKSPMLYYKTFLAQKESDWVVLVHGAGGSSAIWFKQLRAFREAVNVLLVDLRGHGRSKDYHGPDGKYSLPSISSDIIAVLDDVGIEAAHFVGVSLGTILIRCVGEIAPERVKSMVMAGAITDFNAWARFLVSLGHTLKYTVPFRPLYRMFAWIIMPGKRARESREVFREEAKKVSPDEFKRWLKLTKEVFGYLKEWAKSAGPCPILYVMGGHDYIFLEPAKELAERYSNQCLEVIEESGHVCNVECPEKFNRTALAFIDAPNRWSPTYS